MKETMDYSSARDLLLARVGPAAAERVPLDRCAGRVLAQDLIAAENIPPFDRSPYDGYAFRAQDTQDASRAHPVTLDILEEIPAGAVPTKEIVPGTAAKILTGAPIPPGADCVCMYEKTAFTRETVTLFAPMHCLRSVELLDNALFIVRFVSRKECAYDDIGSVELFFS